MSLFTNLRYHLVQRAISRGDMPEEIDAILRLSTVLELLEFEATRFVRVNTATERPVEINYSINFIPLSTQSSYNPLEEAQVMSSIIDMSNARALSQANIMSGISLREYIGATRGTLGGVNVNALEYRLSINGDSVRAHEIISSSNSRAQVFLNHISIEEFQEVINRVAPSSIGPRVEMEAFLEVSVTRTEAFVPVSNSYNTTNQIYEASIQNYPGVVPHYDNTEYYGSYSL